MPSADRAAQLKAQQQQQVAPVQPQHIEPPPRGSAKERLVMAAPPQQQQHKQPAAAEVEVDLDADDADVGGTDGGASAEADAGTSGMPESEAAAAAAAAAAVPQSANSEAFDSEPDDLDQYVAETTAAPLPALPAGSHKDPEVAMVQRELTGEVGLLTRDLRDAQRGLSASEAALQAKLAADSGSTTAAVRQAVDEFVAYSNLVTQLTARLKSAATRLGRLNANPTRHVASAMATTPAEPEQDEVQLAQLVLRREQDDLNQDLRMAKRAQAVREAAVRSTNGSGAAKAELKQGQAIVDSLQARLARVTEDAAALTAANNQTRQHEHWAHEQMEAHAAAAAQPANKPTPVAVPSSSSAAAAAHGASRSPVAGSAAAGARDEVSRVLHTLKAEDDSLQAELQHVARHLATRRAELRAAIDQTQSASDPKSLNYRALLDVQSQKAAEVASAATQHVQLMARALSLRTRIDAVEAHPTAASAVAAAAVSAYGDSMEDDITRALHIINGERDALNREVRAQKRAHATADAQLAGDPKNPIFAAEAAKHKQALDKTNARLSAVTERIERLHQLQLDLARDTERARVVAAAAADAAKPRTSPAKPAVAPASAPAAAAAAPTQSPATSNVVARQSGAVNGDAVVRMLNDQFRFLHLPREVTSFQTLEGTSACAQFICEIVEAFAQKYGVTMPPLKATPQRTGAGFDGAPVPAPDADGKQAGGVTVGRITRVLETMQKLTGIDTAGYGLSAYQLLAGDGPQVAHLVLLIDVLFRSLAAPTTNTAADGQQASAADASTASRAPSPIKPVAGAGPTTAHASIDESTLTFGSSAIASPSRPLHTNFHVAAGGVDGGAGAGAAVPLIASASKPKAAAKKKSVHVDSNASQTIPASPMAAASPQHAGAAAATGTGFSSAEKQKSRRAQEQARIAANTAGLEDDEARANVYARDLQYLAAHAAAEKREAQKRDAQRRAAEQKYAEDEDDGYDYEHVPVDDGEAPSAGRSRGGTGTGGGPGSNSGGSVLARRAERLAGELERLREHRLAAQRKSADLVARAQMTAAERDAYERGLLRRREAVLAAQQQHAHDAAYEYGAEPSLRKSQDELEALRHIAERARRKHEQKTGQAGVTGASARAAIVNHGNELLAAARRREDKQTFNALKRMMAHTNVKRTAVGLERGQLDMERDLITRDVRRQAWLENATAQGVSFATSARAARVAAASAALDDNAAAMSGRPRRSSRSPTGRAAGTSGSAKKFGEFSPFAKPKGGSAKKKTAKAPTNSTAAASAGAAGAGAAAAAQERASALAAADKRYFSVQRKQHKAGDEAATQLVWEEIAGFEKKLRSQVKALNDFYTSQIGAIKDESVSVRARKKLQAEAVRELQRDIKLHQDKIRKLLGDELDHRDAHYRYTLEQQIPRSDGGQEWARPPDTTPMTTKAKLFWDLNFPKQQLQPQQPQPAAGAGGAAAAAAGAASPVGAAGGSGVETHVPRAKFLSAFHKAFAGRGFPYEVCERVVDIIMLGGSGSAYVDVAHFAEFLTLSGGHFDTCMEVLAASLIERNGHVARWFHGLMERDPAVAAIAAKPNSYLVRLSHNAAAKGQYHLLTHTKQPAGDPNAKSVFIQFPITPRNGVYWATTSAGGQQRSFPSLMTILAEVCKDLTPVSSTWFRHVYSEAAERKFAAEALIPYTHAPRPLVVSPAAGQQQPVASISESAGNTFSSASAPAPGTPPMAANSLAVRRSSGSGPAGGAGAATASVVVAPNVRRMSGAGAAGPAGGGGAAVALASALLAVDINAPPAVPAAQAAAPAAKSHYTESFAAGAAAAAAKPVSPPAAAATPASPVHPSAAAGSSPASPATPPVVWTELESAAYHAGVSLNRIVPITRVTLATPFVGAEGGAPGRYELWKAVYGGRGVIVKLYNNADKHRDLWLRELAFLSRPALFDPHITVLEAVVPHPHPALCLVLACPSHEAHHTAADLRLLEALTKPPVAAGGAPVGAAPGAVMATSRVAWLDNVLHRTQAAVDLLEALVVLHTPHSTATARQLNQHKTAGPESSSPVGPTPPGAPDVKSCESVRAPRMGVVVHGDLTPANCLLNSSHRLQLTGFAFARTLPVDAAAVAAAAADAKAKAEAADQPGASPQHRAAAAPPSPQMHGRALPPSAAALAALAALDEAPSTAESADNERYCAPEVLRSGTYTTASDIWQFGIVLWQLWRGPQPAPEPFAGLSTEAAVQTILSKGCLGALDVPVAWPEPIRRALTACWQPKAEQRPTAAQLLTSLREYQRSIPIVKTPYTSFNADAIQDLVFSS